MNIDLGFKTLTNKELIEFREKHWFLQQAYDNVHIHKQTIKDQFDENFCQKVFEDKPLGLGLSNRQVAIILNCGLGSVATYRAMYEKNKVDEVVLESYDYSHIVEKTFKEDIQFNPLVVEEQVFLVISDLQIGCYRVATGYDRDPIDTAIKYFDKLKSGLLSIIEKRAIAIENLNIICLGDLVDGWDIYPNQTTLTMQKQMEILAEQMLELIGFISENIKPKNINLYSVYGNHGRISRTHDKGDNWDVIAMSHVNFAINQFKKTDERFYNVNSYISNRRVQIHEIGKWKYLITHGDQRGLRPDPNSALRKSQRWVRALGWHDAMLIGHWHQFRWFSLDGMQFLAGGCAYESPFVREEIGGREDMVQVLFGCTDKTPISWVETIDMELDK